MAEQAKKNHEDTITESTTVEPTVEPFVENPFIQIGRDTEEDLNLRFDPGLIDSRDTDAQLAAPQSVGRPSSTGSFVFTEISDLVNEPQTDEEEVVVESQLIEQDRADRELNKLGTLSNKIREFQVEGDEERIGQEIEAAIKDKTDTRTIGRIVFDKLAPDMPEGLKQWSADLFDSRIQQDRNINYMAKLLEYEDLASAADVGLNITVPIDDQLKASIRPSDKAFVIPNSSLGTKGYAQDPVELDLDVLAKNYGPILGGRISYPGGTSHNTGGNAPGPTKLKPENLEVRNVQDALNFLNLIELDGTEHENFGETMTLLFEGEVGLAGSEYARVAEKKWGPNWRWRLAAFTLKEIGVDAALIALAAFFPAIGGPLLIGKKGIEAARVARAARSLSSGLRVGNPAAEFALGRRFNAAVGRAVYIGVGGGGVQAGLNVATGQPHELLQEAGVRTLGLLGVQGAGAALKGAFKLTPFGKALRAVRNDIAKARGVPTYSSKVVAAASKIDPPQPALARLLRLASLFNPGAGNKPLRTLAAKATLAISNPEANQKIVKDIVEQLRIDPKHVELVPLEAEIFRDIVEQTVPFKQAKQIAKGARRTQKAAQEAVDDLQRRLNKIRKYHKNRPLDKKARGYKTAAAKRRAQINTLKEQLARAKQGLGEADINLGSAEARLAEFGPEGPVGSGSSLADAVAMGEAVGWRVITNEFIEGNAQKLVNKMYTHNMLPLGQMSFRLPELKPESISRTLLWRWLGDPEDVLPDGSLAKDFLDAFNRASRIRKIFRQMRESAIEDLDKKQIRDLMDALDRGNDLGVLWKIDELVEQGLDYATIDSYYAVRKIFDLAHHTIDEIITKQFKQIGVRVRKSDGAMVRLIRPQSPKKVTKSGKIKDDPRELAFQYETIDATAARPKETGTIKIGETKPLVSAIKFEKGYVPIAYKDARYHVSSINVNTREVKRLIAAPNRKEADLGLSQEMKNNTDENLLFFVDRWDSISNRVSISMQQNLTNLVDVVDNRTLNAISSAIDEAAKRDPTQAVRLGNLRVALDKLSLTNLKTKGLGLRAPRRLRRAVTPELQKQIDGIKANVKDGVYDEAHGKELIDNLTLAPREFDESVIAEYLENIAFKAGMSDWRIHAINRFKEIYVGGNAQRQVLGDNVPWYAPISEEGSSDAFRKGNLVRFNNIWIREAKQMQKWLMRSITYKTTPERWFDRFIDTTVANWHRSPVASQRAAAQILENRFFPSLTRLIGGGRAVSGATKLLFFNVGQFIVQSSQVVPTLGTALFTRPHIIGPAIADMITAIGVAARERSEAIFLFKNVAKIYGKKKAPIVEAMRISGWFEDLTVTDIPQISGITGSHYSKLRNTFQESVLPTSVTLGKKIYNAGTAFFKAGEGTNRLFAFSLVRREFIDRIQRGGRPVLGFDGKPFKVSDIDSPEFIREVVNKAKTTALNMTRPGQLELFSGLGSLVFQFKQVLPKSIRIFTVNDLTPAEKFGAAAAYVGFWGFSAIPLLHDLITFTEASYWRFVAGKEPNEREFISNWMREHSMELAQYAWATEKSLAVRWGIDREFLSDLINKGSVFALTDGEVNIVNRIALGKFISDMVDNMEPQDSIVFFSVITDTWQAFTDAGDNPNIISALEDYYRGGLTGYEAANSVLKNFGRVISSAGYVSRFIENLDQDKYDPNFNPGAVRMGLEEETIKSSSGRDTGVLLEGVGIFGKLRLHQFLLGLTPGPVVSELERVKRERTYRTALREFMDLRARKYARLNTPDARLKLLAETISEIEDVYPLVAGMQLDLPMTRNPRWIYQETFSRFWREWQRFHGF